VYALFDQSKRSDFYTLVTGIANYSTLFGPAQFRHALVAHGIPETTPLGTLLLACMTTEYRSKSNTAQDPAGRFDEISTAKIRHESSSATLPILPKMCILAPHIATSQDYITNGEEMKQLF
jgi:hypothetical protein